MRSITYILLSLYLTLPAMGQTKIGFDASQVLNTNADKVGIWVNTIHDFNNSNMTEGLKTLNLKSLRYGWMYGVFDKNDLKTQLQRPTDFSCQGQLTENGRLAEEFGVSDVADMLTNIGGTGFAVVNTDGINYIGGADAELAAMSKQEKTDLFAGYAADWASWGQNKGFEYYEIGNENDLPGEGGDNGVIADWDPAEYASVALAYNQAIKAAYPNAKTGVNGGLKGEPQNVEWFDNLFESEPTLADEIDFVVAHVYEFHTNYLAWRGNVHVPVGRLKGSINSSREKHFPNLPIHVTEIGSFFPGENDRHYRAVMMTEMLGNVYISEAVEHVQVWPTKWDELGGVFSTDDQYNLTGMGLGVLAYTKYAKPILVANGYSEKVRFFASRNDQNEMTVWLVNHAEEETTVSVDIQNFEADPTNEAFALYSPSSEPYADDTKFTKVSSVKTNLIEGVLSFETSLKPTSVTVIHFSKDADYQEIVTASSSKIQGVAPYPNPVRGSVKIQAEGIYQAELISINGKSIWKADGLRGQQQIEMQNFPKGIYYLKVLSGETMSNYKIIKE